MKASARLHLAHFLSYSFSIPQSSLAAAAAITQAKLVTFLLHDSSSVFLATAIRNQNIKKTEKRWVNLMRGGAASFISYEIEILHAAFSPRTTPGRYLATELPISYPPLSCWAAAWHHSDHWITSTLAAWNWASKKNHVSQVFIDWLVDSGSIKNWTAGKVTQDSRNRLKVGDRRLQAEARRAESLLLAIIMLLPLFHLSSQSVLSEFRGNKGSSWFSSRKILWALRFYLRNPLRCMSVCAQAGRRGGGEKGRESASQDVKLRSCS